MKPADARPTRSHRQSFQPFRRAAFFLQALILVGLPFLEVGGESALRFDVPTLRLLFFGHTLWMQEFFLLLLVILWLTFLIILATTVLGRLWCGWLCPQSAIIELVDWLGDLLRIPHKSRRSISHVLVFALSGLVSATIIWYFVAPSDFFRTLSLPFHASAKTNLVQGFFVGQWLLIYAEVAFLGRRFCATICPYAKLQGALFDRDTLVIEFDRSRADECRACDLCVRVCPTGMDIKDGLRAECIACARCLDACCAMTSPRGIETLVDYRWGGWRRLARPPVLLLGLAVAVLSALSVWWALGMTPLEFTVSRPPGELYTVSPSGAVLANFRVHAQNKDRTEATIRLTVEPGDTFRILGPDRLKLLPGEDRVFPVPVTLAKDVGSGAHELTFVFTDLGNGQDYRRGATFYAP